MEAVDMNFGYSEFVRNAASLARKGFTKNDGYIR